MIQSRHLLIVPILLASLVLTAGCPGTRNAYTAAKGDPEATAKIVTEQYTAIVHELNTLKTAGALTGAQLENAQDAVRTTKPLIDELAIAAQNYAGVRSATTEAELTTALNKAILQVSKLVDIMRNARHN